VGHFNQTIAGAALIAVKSSKPSHHPSHPSTWSRLKPMPPSSKKPSSIPFHLLIPNDPPTGELACPILLEAQNILEKAHDLRKALRRLSRSTRQCLTCLRSDECPSMRSFNQSVDLAIHQLMREWGLDQD
jgi:hypothetical protein